jgi:hypothetical protein
MKAIRHNIAAIALALHAGRVGSMTHQNVPYQIWDLQGRVVAVERFRHRTIATLSGRQPRN